MITLPLTTYASWTVWDPKDKDADIISVSYPRTLEQQHCPVLEDISKDLERMGCVRNRRRIIAKQEKDSKKKIGEGLRAMVPTVRE
jgi:hypothetical protein